MIIPSVPNAKMISPNGYLTDTWRVFFVQLVNQLQQFVNDEGYILPSQDQNNVDQLNTNEKIGGIIYNETGKFTQINTDGIYKNVSSYEELSTSAIGDIPAGQRNGRFILETDTGDLKVGVDDTFKTVTVT